MLRIASAASKAQLLQLNSRRLAILPYIFRSEDKKPPSGFEKFLKKTRAKKEELAQKDKEDKENKSEESEAEDVDKKQKSKRPSIADRLKRGQDKKKEEGGE